MDNTILKVQKFIGNPANPETLEIEGIVWDKEKPVYKYPCDLGKLQMWDLKWKPSKKSVTRQITVINNKIVRLSVLK